MKTLLIFLLLTENVFAMDWSIKPKETAIKHEPIVRVERYVAPNYKNDPTVLIAGVKENTNTESKEHIVEKIVYKDRLVIDNPDPEPITKIIWESN